MTPAQLASYVRFKTKTDSDSFTDEDMLVLCNLYKDEIANQLNDADENMFGVVVEFDLESGLRKYPLDPDIMSKIRYFEVDFDGNGEYQRLVEYDLNTLEIPTDENSIKAYFAGKDAGYFIHGDEVYILNDSDIEDVTNGLRMWITAFPGDITSMGATTDMSQAPDELHTGFPKTLHELLARRIIIEYKTSQEKPVPLTESEVNYEKDLEKKISILNDKNRDRNVIAQVPSNTGQDY